MEKYKKEKESLRFKDLEKTCIYLLNKETQNMYITYKLNKVHAMRLGYAEINLKHNYIFWKSRKNDKWE